MCKSDLHTPQRPITLGILTICPDQGAGLPLTAYCASYKPPDQPGPPEDLNEGVTGPGPTSGPLGNTGE